MMHLFFSGFILGFLIAMPFGPIAVVIVQNSLHRGKFHGLIAGLGATLADACFAVIVGLGVTLISAAISNYGPWLQLVGASVFAYLGIKNILSPVHQEAIKTSKMTETQVFFSTFLITITSPMTFLTFVGVYTGLLGPLGIIGLLETVVLTVGVILGSACWAFILSYGAHSLGKRFKTLSSSRFSLILDCLVLIFAGAIGYSGLSQFFV